MLPDNQLKLSEYLTELLDYFESDQEDANIADRARSEVPDLISRLRLWQCAFEDIKYFGECGCVKRADRALKGHD